jgi:glutathione S-transferase
MGKLMKLYEFAPTRSIRVRWTLQELGVDFESVPVNPMVGETRHPDFLKINPAGKVPVLVDGDLVLTESVAIAIYLAEKYPHKGFLPADIQQRSQVYRWILFAVTELEQLIWRIARHTKLYPEHLRLPAEVSLARKEFADIVAVMEAHMQDRQFIVGNTLTIADFVCAYTLDWASMAGLLDDSPLLYDYMERMFARPHAPLRIAAAIASLNA